MSGLPSRLTSITAQAGNSDSALICLTTKTGCSDQAEETTEATKRRSPKTATIGRALKLPLTFGDTPAAKQPSWDVWPILTGMRIFACFKARPRVAALMADFIIRSPRETG